MDDEEIEKIENRWSPVRKGPWVLVKEETTEKFGTSFFIQIGKCHSNTKEVEISGVTPEDVEFIINAIDDVPTLIAEVRRLKKLLGK